jgi:hypothetical protein
VQVENDKRPASTFFSDWATEEGCEPVFFRFLPSLIAEQPRLGHVIY